MDEATKEALRNHWIPRVLRLAREAFNLDRDPLYLILDAACLATPLFPNEPWFARPTPQRPKQGGVIRYVPGTKDKALFTVAMNPRAQRAVPLRVCYVNELVDNLGRLIEAAELDSREAEALLDKVRRWVFADDTLDDDTPDEVSLKLTAAARASKA